MQIYRIVMHVYTFVTLLNYFLKNEVIVVMSVLAVGTHCRLRLELPLPQMFQ